LNAPLATDGRVINPTVIQSLDTRSGLDEEAIKAAKQWLFAPGMTDGKPVNVLVSIELTLTLKR
jgi:TonB family protein